MSLELCNETAPTLAQVRQSLVSLIKQADRAGANALLNSWAAHHGYEQVFKELLEPALIGIGESITGEKHTLAQAYVAAKVAEDMLTRAVNQPGASDHDEPAKGPVVLGNPEGDFHALGRRMVATMLRSKGWLIHDLGNDVPAEEFIGQALATGARIIGVSAMTMTTAQGIRALRQEIDARGLRGRIQLAVGGAVFLVMPGLAEDVGGDGTASSMFAAPALFDRLWQASLQAELSHA
ncbi:MAG: cobalamin-dependent protein [Candidatus Accumulibacter sp.]|uniref:cobalamin B12-binding domain-containing protein n=1 Tax=Accumulibacter sp. TaxID=2053492 RepID=UPI00287A4EF1|nr:cobalamin-dependent protein [Accumulibacter sp.]MDS4015954.1 cobalamin-dependent protein [Accumulibacter sp.]